jgi:hypothetical protein
MLPALKPAVKPALQDWQNDSLMVLLRGLQKHAVAAEEAGHQEFRTKLAALENSFRGKENAQQIAEAAVSLLAQYQEKLHESVKQQRTGIAETAAGLATATKALEELNGSTDRLATIEQQIGAVSSLEDLASIKTRLKSELAMARAEALQERQKILGLISYTATQLAVPGHPPSARVSGENTGYVLDRLTGLPMRAYAESELAQSFEKGADCYLVIFVVKRLALINAKFGFARGDQVLLKVVAHLAQSLPDFQDFFRWTPCSFVGVAPPHLAFRELRSKVQVIELTRITPTLEWQGHAAMVPVALDCRVISLKDFGTLPELFLRLDTLASDV